MNSIGILTISYYEMKEYLFLSVATAELIDTSSSIY